MTLFVATLSPVFGRMSDRTGPGVLLVAGSLVTAGGYAMMALTAPGALFWEGVLPAMCLIGLGMSMVVAPLSSAVMGAVEEDQSGIASGINNAATRMAGLISVAAMGGIVAASYRSAGGTASFGEMTDAAGHGVAMSAGLTTVAWVAAVLCLLSAGLAWRLPHGSEKPEHR